MATARTTPHAANWASGAFYEREVPVPPARPTAYELLIEQMGMTKAPLFLLAEEPAIRRWVKSHKNSRYVPEAHLNALGAHVCIEDWQ